MQDQIYKLREEVEGLKARIQGMEACLSRLHGPGFLGEVVQKESRRTTRPGQWADVELIRFLRGKGVKVDKLKAPEIHEHLRKSPELLKESMDYMQEIERECSSDSFREVWNALKELRFLGGR